MGHPGMMGTPGAPGAPAAVVMARTSSLPSRVEANEFVHQDLNVPITPIASCRGPPAPPLAPLSPSFPAPATPPAKSHKYIQPLPQSTPGTTPFGTPTTRGVKGLALLDEDSIGEASMLLNGLLTRSRKISTSSQGDDHDAPSSSALLQAARLKMHMEDADAMSKARSLVDAPAGLPASTGDPATRPGLLSTDSTLSSFDLPSPMISPSPPASGSHLHLGVPDHQLDMSRSRSKEIPSRDRFRSVRHNNTSLQLSLNPTPAGSPTHHAVDLPRDASPSRKAPLQASFSFQDLAHLSGNRETLSVAQRRTSSPEGSSQPVIDPMQHLPLRPTSSHQEYMHGHLGRSTLSHEIVPSSGSQTPAEERQGLLLSHALSRSASASTARSSSIPSQAQGIVPSGAGRRPPALQTAAPPMQRAQSECSPASRSRNAEERAMLLRSPPHPPDQDQPLGGNSALRDRSSGLGRRASLQNGPSSANGTRPGRSGSTGSMLLRELAVSDELAELLQALMSNAGYTQVLCGLRGRRHRCCWCRQDDCHPQGFQELGTAWAGGPGRRLGPAQR